MNASATIRASYVRAIRVNNRTSHSRGMSSTEELEARPANEKKLASFKPVNHIEHREACDTERKGDPPSYNDVYPLPEAGPVSFMDFDDFDVKSCSRRLRKMLTIFPYRDPIYLVAIIFAAGSLDLVIDAFFDLFPERFETQETVAIPTTVLIGSIFFFIAGIFDVFAALNVDHGTIETTKDIEAVHATYKPALLGSKQWSWLPSMQKFNDLLFGNLAFQAGMIVLVGGVIFMFAGVVDFPGIIPEESPLFSAIVFGPQALHGAMFFVANAMLAISEQEKWWKPKVGDSDWQGAFMNTLGGFGFMLAGIFLFQEHKLAAAVSALVGSLAFLVGSVMRWYVVMEVY